MVSFPDWLKQPGTSFEYVTWLRKFIEENLPPDVDTPGGADADITSITSDDGSITVTNPTGPIPDLSVVEAYAFRQINVYTIAAGTSGMVPDGSWAVVAGPTPKGITFASGIWTISVPGIYVASAGCRFEAVDPATVGGIFNFTLFIPGGGNIMDTQTAIPIGPIFATGGFVANPANSMMWDTGTDLAFSEVHHEFDNTSDVDVDVGFVNVNIWRIAPSPGPLGM